MGPYCHGPQIFDIPIPLSSALQKSMNIHKYPFLEFKHLESLDREYAEQKSALEDMQSRLDDLAKERLVACMYLFAKLMKVLEIFL